jgi:single-stranded-DNA-specific exonuclease
VRLVELLRHFGPFGIGNPSPMFASRNVKLLRPPRIVREEHAKLLVSDGTGRLEVIGFGMAERLHLLREGDTLDIAYHLQLDDWNGRYRPQARLCDFRQA